MNGLDDIVYFLIGSVFVVLIVFGINTLENSRKAVDYCKSIGERYHDYYHKDVVVGEDKYSTEVIVYLCQKSDGTITTNIGWK